MSDRSDSTEGSPNADSDWIKGLVAEALIRATDEEAELDAVPDAPVRTPEPSVGLQATPLVVGRGLPETEAAEESRQVPSVDSPMGPADQDDPAEVNGPAREAGVPGAVDATFGGDEVMVAEEVTTEGFRSSDIRTVLEWLAVIVSALAVALIIKAFVLQAFYIPSESMETTVNEGDRILVNKVSYRLHDVRRGDLVVFKKLPGTASATDDLIKRAIALPGETIEVRTDGRIWIWGPGEGPEDALLLEEPYLDPQNELLAAPSASDPLTIDVWDARCTNQPRTPGRCALGPDQYFMMGDNRSQSSDSRFFGPVDGELIVGRAFLRIWPLGELSSL